MIFQNALIKYYLGMILEIRLLSSVLFRVKFVFLHGVQYQKYKIHYSALSWIGLKKTWKKEHGKFSEIDFLFVSYRGDRYLSDAFGPMKNIVPSRRSGPMCNSIAHAIFNCLSWKTNFKTYILIQFLSNHPQPFRICSVD